MTLRAWIAVALLAGSWLLGLSYYEPADRLAWSIVLTVGSVLLCLSQVPLAFRKTARVSGTESSALPCCTLLPKPPALLALLLLLPVAWIVPEPYRAAPLLMAIGLVLWLLSQAWTWVRLIATGGLTAGVVLFVQAVALSGYATETARSHDAPWPGPQLVAIIARLLGTDATADGPNVVLGTIRQPHRLAVTWDSFFDPATVCFLFGGLAMLAVMAWSRLPVGQRFSAWLGAARGLAITVLLWLPVRAALMFGFYMHRALRTDYSLPLHVMNHFLSPWVHLLLLIVPVLLAWRFARFGVQDSQETDNQDLSPKAQDPSPNAYLSAALVLLSAALAASAVYWQPSGDRKQGRVVWVERHSTWSPTLPNGLSAGGTYDTEHFGGDPDRQESLSGYNYAAVCRYLGQFYEIDRIQQKGRIDDETLANCDVLVIKIPKDRYTEEEVSAVVRFVRRGGGLLLIGDHTNYQRSSSHINDIARHFGFTYRDDLLYSEEPSPDRQHSEAARVPHPAVQHVPAFDFAVSCSIDPGTSGGRPVVQAGRLFSMPADYRPDNYMPAAQHVPEMRYGPFDQVWAADAGRGRVLAWTDSTMFSNFCLHQPGKAELMLNMVEWLNHRAPPLAPYWPLLGLSVLPLAVLAWLALRHGATFQLASWPLLLSAAVFGWLVGSEASAALNRRGLPLPEAVRPLPRVVIDRTTSQVPLALGPDNEDKKGNGFGLLEQWIPRLGYYTMRGEGDEAFSGKALVVICPSREPSKQYLDRLVQYVAEGGRLLVIDSQENESSTANELLHPFGLKVDSGQDWQGELRLAGTWPAIRIERAREVLGGQRVASLGDQRTVCATVRHEKGLVMALSFGSLFNDTGMGGSWMHNPDDQEQTRYQVLFALLRMLVEDRPIVAPMSSAIPTKPELLLPTAKPAGPGPRLKPLRIRPGG